MPLASSVGWLTAVGRRGTESLRHTHDELERIDITALEERGTMLAVSIPISIPD